MSDQPQPQLPPAQPNWAPPTPANSMPQQTPPMIFPNAPDQPIAMAMRQLVKVFGNKVAVAGISLDIPVGSFYGIVGPNGAGKTTTLSMATGLLVPDQGTAFILDHDMWADPAAAKALLGVLPDSDASFDRLTGFEFVCYAGILYGLDKQLARSRAVELLQALGLADNPKLIIAEYSAGMKKKVALASALIHSPKVLVLDEPFESVDPISAGTIKEILTSFCKSGGTVVFSSHVMATVEQLCSHVAVINAGQLRAAGTVSQVAAGASLEDRFTQLVGGAVHAQGLDWLTNPGAGQNG